MCIDRRLNVIVANFLKLKVLTNSTTHIKRWCVHFFFYKKLSNYGKQFIFQDTLKVLQFEIPSKNLQHGRWLTFFCVNFFFYYYGFRKSTQKCLHGFLFLKIKYIQLIELHFPIIRYFVFFLCSHLKWFSDEWAKIVWQWLFIAIGRDFEVFKTKLGSADFR